jgi:hypothetical protein
VTDEPIKGHYPKRHEGRALTFKTGAELAKACADYFVWLNANPFIRVKTFQYQGAIVQGEEPVPRAPTVTGLALFLGVHRDSWYKWSKDERFADVCAAVTDELDQNKIELAAAGMLESMFIGKLMGIADKVETTHSGSISQQSDEDLDKRIAELLGKQ